MARKIYLSTSIFTSKTEDPFDGAIVVDGNEILYVGDREHAKEYEENAQIEDLGDRTVSPGLIDCHTHAYMGAKMSKLTSFFVPDGLSEKEVICAMKEFVASHSLKEGEV